MNMIVQVCLAAENRTTLVARKPLFVAVLNVFIDVLF